MWRRTTATMYYRSPNPTIRPAHVTASAYEARVVARRKRLRLLKSTIAAAFGGAIASLLFAMVYSGLSSE